MWMNVWTNYWVGLCWAAGSVYFVTLDYRAKKGAGKQWLSKDWPWILFIYFVVGGGFAVVGYTPILIYRFSETLIGLYNHPPTLNMLLGFIPVGLAAIPFIEIMKVVGRAIDRKDEERQSRSPMATVSFFAFVVSLSILAVIILGTGYYFSFRLLHIF